MRQRHVDPGFDGRERRSQLMRCVGSKASLAIDGFGEATNHGVQRVGELSQFVARRHRGDTLMQVALGDAAGGRRYCCHRLQARRATR